jgi:hypothetical protein
MSAWPHPRGIIRPTKPIPESLFRVRERPSCPQCGCTDLNQFRYNGKYQSRRTGEVRDAVICRPCGRAFYLPLGLHVPRKPKISLAQREARAGTSILPNDPRPACLFCHGHHIRRRGILPCGTQRWYCCSCQRRFVARGRFRTATLDRRRCTRVEDLGKLLEDQVKTETVERCCPCPRLERILRWPPRIFRVAYPRRSDETRQIFLALYNRAGIRWPPHNPCDDPEHVADGARARQILAELRMADSWKFGRGDGADKWPRGARQVDA